MQNEVLFYWIDILKCLQELLFTGWNTKEIQHGHACDIKIILTSIYKILLSRYTILLCLIATQPTHINTRPQIECQNV